MPCKCKVRCSNHHINTNRDITARARFPGQRNLWPGKVSRAEKYLPRKGFWEKHSFWERFPGQRKLCPGNVCVKRYNAGR